MRRWLSVFIVGGNLAYRGLFNWIHPAIYMPTMLGAPLFQLIFFTKLGQFAHARTATSTSSATRSRRARCRPCTE